MPGLIMIRPKLNFSLLSISLGVALAGHISLNLNASPCISNKVKLQVLGSGGPELDDQRASTSYLIWVNGKARLLIDAGAGSSFNYEKTGAKIENLQAILLTHLHVDHSADIPAYIKASYFTRRNKDLLIFGPAGNQLMPSTSTFIKNLFGAKAAFRYLNEYINRARQSDYYITAKNVPLNKKKITSFKISDKIKIKAIAVHHGPVAAIAWRAEIGNCSISFSGDMSNKYDSIAALVRNSDLFVAHNAIPESAKGIAVFLHMRPSTIGKISSRARVKKLILSHRMNRTLGNEKDTLRYIKKYYKGKISFANDLDTFSIK